MDIFNIKKEIVRETLLDDDIYCYLIKHNRVLTLDKDNYVRLYINGKNERLHIWIMKYYGELMVDHKDSNTLNNQISNLRISNSVNNAQNKCSRKGASSKYIGVSFTDNRKKWKVDIGEKYLGVFDTEEEAVIVRNKKAQELNDKDAKYKIEIYDDKPLKINRVDNKQIIRTNKNIIDKQYIMNINKVVDLTNFVKDRKLNAKNGGPIKVREIQLKNLEQYKKIIIETLYPLK